MSKQEIERAGMTDAIQQAVAAVRAPQAPVAEHAEPVEDHDGALKYARRLATAIHASEYPEVAQWEPLPDLLGLLTQIDNMAAGMARKSSASPAHAIRSMLEAATQWIEHAPHGDNCFVSDNYPGDPGDRCNCGKESLLAAIGQAMDTAPQAPQQAECPECIEQARLLGAGGEREAALTAEIEQLRRVNEQYGQRERWWNDKMVDLEHQVASHSAGIARLQRICTSIHDGLLRGDDDRELIDLAAQAWDGGQAPQQAELTDEQAAALVYKGNSVSYIYGRAKAYGNEITECWGEMHARTDGCLSNVPLHDAIRAALASSGMKDPAPIPGGWTFNHAQQDSDGIWEIGYQDHEDDRFSPVITVNTGLYYQAQDAEPLARAILARISDTKVTGSRQ